MNIKEQKEHEQFELLKFAARYPDKWHSWAHDKYTNDAIEALLADDLIEVNKFRQFRYKRV